MNVTNTVGTNPKGPEAGKAAVVSTRRLVRSINVPPLGTRALRELLPPIVHRLLKQSVERVAPQRREWEVVPEGWAYRDSHPEVRGWNVDEVVQAELAKWPGFVEVVQSSRTLGSVYYTPNPQPYDLTAHNWIMIFGYCLALSAGNHERLRMLDWGGGLGQYAELARALVPGIELDYHGFDVPLLVEHARRLQPEHTFVDDRSCLEHEHDFTLVSGSLQYAQDWRGELKSLAAASSDLILVTQLPTVEEAPAYVQVQRAYRYNYATEYLGWCFHRGEFLNGARAAGLTLLREFLGGEHFKAYGAQEECRYRGFLFRRQSGGERLMLGTLVG